MFRFDSTFRAEFREKWLVLVVGFCGFIFGFAAPSFALPFIYPEVIREFGWTREEAALIASSKYLVGAVAALLIGRFVDVIGTWLALIFAIGIGGVALLSFLWIESLTSYYLAGVLLGFASGGTMVALKVLISRAFHASQGTAMGVAMLGTTIGSVIIPLAVSAAIGTFGWRVGMAAMSTGIWLVAIPLLLYGFLFKRHALDFPQQGAPEAGGQAPRKQGMIKVLRTVAGERRFWTIALAVFLVSMVDQAFTQHQVLIFTDIGLTRQQIAFAASAIGGIGIAARIFAGNIFDATSTKGVAALYTVLGLSSFFALGLGSPAIFLCYVVLIATAHAAVVIDDTILTKHVYGPAMLGNLIGIYTAVASLAFATGPWLMGRMFDQTGSYQTAFIVFGTLPLVAAALVLTVKPTFWLNMRASRASASELQGRGTAIPAE